MVKHLKTRKGQFYKLLKNGEKRRISQREYRKMKTRKNKINIKGGGFTELGINDSEIIVRKKLNSAFGNPIKFYKFIDKIKDNAKIDLMINNTIKILKESKSWKEVNIAAIFPRMNLDTILSELFNENEIKEINSPPVPSASASASALEQGSSALKGKSILELIKSNIKSTEEKVLKKDYKINRIEITMENRDAKILEINNRLNELYRTSGRIYLYLTKLSADTNDDFKEYAKANIGTKLSFSQIDSYIPTEPYKMVSDSLAATNARNVASITNKSSDGVSYFHHEFGPNSEFTYLGIIYSDFGDYDEGFEHCGTELIYFDKLTNTFNIFMMPVEEGDFIIFDDAQFMHRFPSKLLDNKSNYRRLLCSVWIKLVEKREMITVWEPEGSYSFLGNVYFKKTEYPPELDMFLSPDDQTKIKKSV
jgi:hypothetical protein